MDINYINDLKYTFINSKGKLIKYMTTPGIKVSAGEMSVIKALKTLKIAYVREVSFADLKTPAGGWYRFDFLLKHLGIIIEYDGKRYHKDKTKDNIKDAYCLKNHIPIYRFSGGDFYNMIECLKKILPAKVVRIPAPVVKIMPVKSFIVKGITLNKSLIKIILK